MAKVAYYISHLFDPFAVSLLAWVLVINSLDETFNTKLIWLLIVAVVSGLPPFGVLLYERKVGKISNWLMTNRLERRDVQIAWVFGSSMLAIIFRLIEAPRVLSALALAMLLISLVVTFVNRYWKISVHMVGMVLFILVMLLVYSSNWLWLVILLPIVAWSRVKLGHHTLSQVTVGTIVAVIITYFSFSLFGLATF